MNFSSVRFVKIHSGAFSSLIGAYIYFFVIPSCGLFSIFILTCYMVYFWWFSNYLVFNTMTAMTAFVDSEDVADSGQLTWEKVK